MAALAGAILFMVTDSDFDIMARTIWAEARGESFAGMLAVAHVIINRWEMKHRRETTLAGVATEPYQFSAWNPGDPNRDKLENVTANDPRFRSAKRAALQAYDEALIGHDPTTGATHYHTVDISPKWANGKRPAVTIGRHHFYTDID